MEPPSQARIRAGRPLLLGLLFVAAVASAAACGGPEPPELLGHAEIGPEPFVNVALRPTPAALEPLLTEAVAAADDQELTPGIGAIERARIRANATTQPFETAGIGLIRPESPASVAVVPGDPEEVCSLSEMIAGFAADSAATAAFASVHGLAPDAVPEYLSSLRAGYLIDELLVINHRFHDAAADPSATILAAGTAVLTDDAGVARVRCECGNPLLPASVELDGQLIDASAFADRVLMSEISTDVPDRVDDAVDGSFTSDPGRALGPPDRIAVSLGEDGEAAAGRCRYSVTLEFTDNRLVDGAGDDLQVLELGRPESSYVLIGNDPDDLRLVGEIGGGDAAIDIAPVATQGETFSVVRLCDGPDAASDVPGTDIDAVVALNSQPR